MKQTTLGILFYRLPQRLRWAFFLSVLVGFIGVWFHLGTILISTTNLDRRASDQKANMDLAADCRSDWFPMRTNAVSNPLWPWMAAKLAWHDDEALFFLKGKWLNLSVGAAALAAGALVAIRWLPILPVVNLLLLTGLGSLLPRAVYFQPEPLYYISFTTACVLGTMLLFRNPLLHYTLFGIAAGFAYLAKSGIDPLLLAWFGAGCWRVFRWALDKDERAKGWGNGVWAPQRHLTGIVLVAAGFGVVATPRLIWANARFGDPFFNMPKYWMWHDDYAAQSVPFLINFSHKSKISALPSDEVPSLRNYIRTHTPRQVLDRLSDGVAAKLSRFFLPESGKRKKNRPWRYLLQNRGHYLVALFFALSLLYIVARFRDLKFTPGDSAAGIFTAAVFGIYVLAFGWYDPIGRGDRFMMTLYAPLVLAICVGIDSLRKRLALRTIELSVNLLHLVIFAFLTWNIIGLLARPVFIPDQPL